MDTPEPEKTALPFERTLLRAARDNDIHVVAAAFAAGEPVDAPEEGTGMTALMIAIENKNLPLVQWLLEAGASVTARVPEKDGQGKNAYHVAASSTPDIMHALLQHPDRAAATEFCKDGKDISSALRIALKNSDRAMVETLLDFGIDVNETDNDGETPLYYLLQHRASRAEGLPFIRLLIENGADVDKAVNYWEETPLLVAARADYTEAVALLLELGADPNRKSHLEDTPLLAAAETWNTKITAMLLDAGADIHARNRIGRTALHVAAQHNRLDIVKSLLARGADPLALDRAGQTADDLCLADFQANTRKLILKKQAELGFPVTDPETLSGKFNRQSKIRFNRQRETLSKRSRRYGRGKYAGASFRPGGPKPPFKSGGK